MKNNLKAGAVALALSVAASSVMADTSDPFAPGKQAPNLSQQEKVLFTLNETTVSIVAALVDAVDCANAEGSYSYSATVFADGTGSATIDDYTINATVVEEFDPNGIPINPNGIRGTRVDVDDDGAEEIGDVELQSLEGTFYFSKLGEIMYSNADFQIKKSGENHWNDYDEHVIKDYYWSPAKMKCDRWNPSVCEYVGGVFNEGRGGIKDAGLEVITKLDYPRAKWREMSEYLQPNNIVGRSHIIKMSIAPENAPLCKVELEGDVIDFGSGLQLGGTVYVDQVGF